MGVDLHPDASRAAAQCRVVHLLDAVLADRKAGKRQQRIAGNPLILFRGGRYVTEHMREHRAMRIMAGPPFLDRQPRQARRVDLDGGDLAPAQPFANEYRHRRPPARRLPQDALAFVGVERGMARDGVERAFGLARRLRREDEAVVRAVHGELGAGAIDDPAALRFEQPQIDPILVGEHPVAVGLDHLELVEPRAEQ